MKILTGWGLCVISSSQIPYSSLVDCCCCCSDEECVTAGKSLRLLRLNACQTRFGEQRAENSEDKERGGEWKVEGGWKPKNITLEKRLTTARAPLPLAPAVGPHTPELMKSRPAGVQMVETLCS
ncbi:hypothetical protein B0T13DRAFT_89761 [Neurospora crassa]|nr:hypothetical protein B0T13DRAFT_89761 [Neurospora crassa]